MQLNRLLASAALVWIFAIGSDAAAQARQGQQGQQDQAAEIERLRRELEQARQPQQGQPLLVVPSAQPPPPAPRIDPELPMVDLLPLDEADARELNDMVWQHAIHTGSAVAWRMVGDWDATWPRFVKVLPKDYGRVMRALAEAEAQGLTGEEAIMTAFEANRRDLARIGGN